MNLGTFSVSLTVKDLQASRTFYEALGFSQIAGNAEENWIIMQNGDANIGLFHGMFERNILTFNPTDARAIQAELKAKGIELTLEADPNTTGPAHLTLLDPDGNPVLIDQHQ